MIHNTQIRADKIRFLLSEIDQSLFIIMEKLTARRDYHDFINLGLLKC